MTHALAAPRAPGPVPQPPAHPERPEGSEQPAQDGWVRAERAFRAMGTDAHVFVWQDREDDRPAHELLDRAQAAITRAEHLWSRFLPDSDVSRINASPDRSVLVAPETLELLAFCAEATDLTDGRFDPLVLPHLLAAGYDRTFEQLPRPATIAEPRREGAHEAHADAGPTTGRRGSLVVDHGAGTATISGGAALDLGGVAKGWTADQVTEDLQALGVLGVCVNLGGDLRARGTVPEPHGLVVGVEDPFGGEDLALLGVHECGVATTARTRRRWASPAGTMHHLIDPSTGRPAAAGAASVTTVAATAARAEVIAKAVFLSPASYSTAALDRLQAAALVVAPDGTTHTLGTLPELT